MKKITFNEFRDLLDSIGDIRFLFGDDENSKIKVPKEIIRKINDLSTDLSIFVLAQLGLKQGDYVIVGDHDGKYAPTASDYVKIDDLTLLSYDERAVFMSGADVYLNERGMHSEHALKKATIEDVEETKAITLKCKANIRDANTRSIRIEEECSEFPECIDYDLSKLDIILQDLRRE